MANKKQDGRKVPNLRFPGFEMEWVEKKLGDIATFSKGKGISKNEIEENGKNECVRYGELYTHYGEVIDEIKSRTNTKLSNLVLSEANDVIIPASGETTIDIATASCVLNSGVALGGDLNIIKTLNNGVFLSYYLNSKSKLAIANLAQGISVVHLYSSQLKLLSIKLPAISEQHKIASFLSLLNERISTQSKIIEGLIVLKGLITKKIFTKQFRFKCSDGKNFPDWEIKSLGDIGEVINGLTYNPKDISEDGVLVLRSSNIQDRLLTFDNNVFVNARRFNAVIEDDILICVRNGSRNLIGKNAIIKKKHEGLAFGAFMAVYRSIYNKFLTYWFDSDYYKEEIHKNLGATINSINGSDLKRFKVPFPSTDEQTKIASFLIAIQSKMETEKSILEQLELQKKYLLKQMFV